MFDAHSSSTGEYQLLDIDAMCWLFDLSRDAVYNRRSRGDFPPAIKVGASLRWRLQDVEVWLSEQREVSE